MSCLISTPLVSIILPTHNGEKYLAQSIESCLGQTYRNIELIIAHDCSTDSTPAIIKQYQEKDQRIIATRKHLNKKLPESLNVGHRISKGAFIAWTSDDNYYAPNAIETLLKFLTNDNRIGMVYSDFVIVDSWGVEQRTVSLPDYTKLIDRNCIGPCFLYRWDVYQATGPYRKSAILAEDYDYWLRISSRFLLYPINESLYYYRVHNTSLTSTSKGNRIRMATQLVLARNISNLHWITKDAKFERCAALMSIAITRREWRLFIVFFILCLKLQPRLAIQRVFYRIFLKE